MTEKLKGNREIELALDENEFIFDLKYRLDYDRRITNFTSFIIEEQGRVPELNTKEFSLFMDAIQSAIKCIASSVAHNGLLTTSIDNIYKDVAEGFAENIHTESSDMMINLTISSHSLCSYFHKKGSEATFVEAKRQGPYVLLFEPLDHSEAVDASSPVGTIFCIYKRNKDGKLSVGDSLQPGSNILAAGYALYSSCTVLVLCLGHGNGVNVFVRDPISAEFIMVDRNVKIPTNGTVLSINGGCEGGWERGIQEFIKKKKSCMATNKKQYLFRFTKSIVAEVHRILYFGGLHLSPPIWGEETGPVSLVSEANPLAFIIREAGGLASNGVTPVLDILPDSLNSKTCLFIGSKEDVTDLTFVLWSIRASTNF